MTGVWQDIKTTFRAIRKWPVPYGVIVLTLAIGIGINTMFFTFFNGMVLRPLPFASPDRLVLVSESQARLEQTQRLVSAPNLRDWREQNHVFAGIQPFVQTTFDLNVKDNRADLRRGVSAVCFRCSASAGDGAGSSSPTRIVPTDGRRAHQREPLRRTRRSSRTST